MNSPTPHTSIKNRERRKTSRLDWRLRSGRLFRRSGSSHEQIQILTIPGIGIRLCTEIDQSKPGLGKQLSATFKYGLHGFMIFAGKQSGFPIVDEIGQNIDRHLRLSSARWAGDLGGKPIQCSVNSCHLFRIGFDKWKRHEFRMRVRIFQERFPKNVSQCSRIQFRVRNMVPNICQFTLQCFRITQCFSNK